MRNFINLKIIIFSLLFFLSLTLVLFFLTDEGDKEILAPLKEYTQGRGDNPFEASEFRYEMLSKTKDSKDKDIDIYELRQQAIEYTKQHNQSVNDNSGISWMQIGPGNIGGRIRSILIHPASPSTILIGAVAGGVWKTTNGGDNWTPTMESLEPLSIGCMLRDRFIPDIVYAGCGEGWGNGDAVYGGGIYKSTNFGDTWIKLPTTVIGPGFDAFRNVLKMSQDDAGNIYAATKNYYKKHGVGDYTTAGGLYKSPDGGTLWSKISPTLMATNYFNPTDVIAYTPSTILFAVNKNASVYGGIYKTVTGGASWTKITAGLPSTGYKRITLEKDPSLDIVYAAFESEDTDSLGDGGLKGIFKSTDKGSTWTTVGLPPKIASTGLRSYLGFQGWYNNVLKVDPFSSSKIYLGGIDMMKTTNGGTNWTQLTYWDTFYGTPVIHADQHAMAFDPFVPEIFYVGNDGGIFKTTDGGLTWTSLNNGLYITQFYSGAAYKSGTSAIYGGTQDNGHLKFSTTSVWSLVEGGDAGYSAQSQTDPLTSYEEFVHLAMSKTTDGGASWTPCTSGLTDAAVSGECLFIAPFSMSEISSDVLIAGSNEVWLTTNAAASWTGVGGGASPGEFISAVTVLGGTTPFKGFAGTTDGKIFKCTTLDPSLGLSNFWLDITPPPTNGAYVRRIVVNPSDPERIIACYSGFNIVPPFSEKHIWLSTTGGASWTDISTGLPNIPVHSAVQDPVDLMTIYAGTESGIFRTTNGGATWTTYSAGMPTYVPVDEIILQKDTYILMAFTHGRSVFATDSPLPVELESFTSSVNGNNVTLNWSTSSEQNNAGFEIQRMIVNNLYSENWVRVGYLDGNGNSNSRIDYQFIDNNLNSGKYMYRLKQIDFNGNHAFYNLHNEVLINLPVNFYLSQNYPNPFNPATVINYQLPVSSFTSLKIFDITGREVATLVNEKQNPGSYSVQFDGSNFSSGVYFYRIEAGEFIDTKRMMLIK